MTLTLTLALALALDLDLDLDLTLALALALDLDLTLALALALTLALALALALALTLIYADCSSLERRQPARQADHREPVPPRLVTIHVHPRRPRTARGKVPRESCQRDQLVKLARG